MTSQDTIFTEPAFFSGTHGAYTLLFDWAGNMPSDLTDLNGSKLRMAHLTLCSFTFLLLVSQPYSISRSFLQYFDPERLSYSAAFLIQSDQLSSLWSFLTLNVSYSFSFFLYDVVSFFLLAGRGQVLLNASVKPVYRYSVQSWTVWVS